MRDVFAAVVALVLLVVAASLGTTLTAFRRRRLRARDSERALGRTILAEIPADDDLRLFCEDAVRFYYGDASVDKDLIVAVRVLINGSPIAAYVSTRHPVDTTRQVTSFEDRPEGHRARSLGRGDRDGQRDDAGRVRRDPGARLAGAGAGRCSTPSNASWRREESHCNIDESNCEFSPLRLRHAAAMVATRASTKSRSDRRLT